MFWFTADPRGFIWPRAARGWATISVGCSFLGAPDTASKANVSKLSSMRLLWRRSSRSELESYGRIFWTASVGGRLTRGDSGWNVCVFRARECGRCATTWITSEDLLIQGSADNSRTNCAESVRRSSRTSWRLPPQSGSGRGKGNSDLELPGWVEEPAEWFILGK